MRVSVFVALLAIVIFIGASFTAQYAIEHPGLWLLVAQELILTVILVMKANRMYDRGK